MTTISSTTRYTGLASGLEVDTIVEELMAAEEIPLEKLYQERQVAEWKQEAYREVTSLLRVFNDTYFDSLAMRGDFSRESDGNRYQIFLEKPTIEFHINITGLEEGTYQQALFALDREHGSSFDTWVEMGMPTNMTQEEIDYLKGVSVPSIVTRKYKLDGAYRAIITVPIFGCVLVVFKREI